VSPAKPAEPIEMPFGLRTRVGPGNHVSDGVQIPHEKEQFLGKGAPLVNMRLCRYGGWVVARTLKVSKRLRTVTNFKAKSSVQEIVKAQINMAS